jgi:AraC-like DNA-binding protein
MQTDQLSALLMRFNMRAGVFHSGNLCGISDYGENGELGGHLHLLKVGKVRVHLAGGQVLHVQGPSLLCFPRATRHRFYVAPGEEVELTCASLQFQGGSGNPIAQAMPEIVIMHVDELVHAIPLLTWLFAEAFESAEGRVAIINRLFELLIIQILRHLILHGKVQHGLLAGLADARLAHAFDALHAHPESAWTIASMASMAGMSRARFAAHFRATVGMTPLDYLTRWRLILAQQKLLAGQPMKLIASAVGYDSSSALARAFRRQLGCSPVAWLSTQRITASDQGHF